MRIPRIYQQSTLASGEHHELSAEAAHHVLNVLRMKAGQKLVLFNGQGGQFEAVIEQAERNRVEVLIGIHHGIESESPLDLTLVQGISRGNRMDMTLQKAVELGVSRLVPVTTEFCTIKLNREKLDKRMEHWRRIVIAACEQCGRNRLPKIENLQSLPDWLTDNTHAMKLILHPVAESSLSVVQDRPEQVILLAGPEGGFSQNEVKQALESGYQGIRIGPRILRTETASLVALAACQTLWGDLCLYE